MRTTRAAIAMVAALTAVWMGCDEDDDPPTSVDSTAPARVTDLTVDVAADAFRLRWTAPGDDGTSGTAASYEVKVSDAAITGGNFAAATAIALSPAPGPAGSLETFIFTGVDTLLVQHFALRARDNAGNVSSVSNDAVWTPRGGSVSYAVDIPSFRDNTIYEESDTLSNALGEFLYSGNNNGGSLGGPDARRGLLAFAIADSIPAGARIDSVTLELNLSKKAPFVVGNSPVALHVVQSDWGEGTSIGDLALGEGGGGSATPGDATWLDRFRGTSQWTTAGGDFAVVHSATVQTNALGKYTWKSAAMTDNVQAWLDSPATNFGWIIVGDEAPAGNARQWDSRQNANAANRPRLTVYYTVGP